MSKLLLNAAREIATQLAATDASRPSPVPTTFIHPETKKETPNALAVQVSSLRELAFAVDHSTVLEPEEASELAKMIGFALRSRAAHVNSLEYSAAYESTKKEMEPRTKMLASLHTKLISIAKGR